MTQVSQPERRVRTGWQPRTLASALLAGVSLGAASGAVGAIFGLALNGWSPREVQLTVLLVLYPAFGGIAGFLLWRRARHPKADSAMLPDGSPEAEERRRARRRRDLALGVAMGCAAAFLATAVDCLWRGWRALELAAFSNLVFYPYLCALLAFNLNRKPGERLSFRPIRINVRTLMLLIGYLALLLGVAVEGHRIGGAAQRYHNQAVSAASQASLFREFERKNATEAPIRRKNAAELRSGRIPDGLLPMQRTFLKSLDSAKADYRTYRYGLIADGEDLQGQMAESNTATYRKLADYFEGLAGKYNEAEKHPWRPVAPDPPRPP